MQRCKDPRFSLKKSSSLKFVVARPIYIDKSNSSLHIYLKSHFQIVHFLKLLSMCACKYNEMNTMKMQNFRGRMCNFICTKKHAMVLDKSFYLHVNARQYNFVGHCTLLRYNLDIEWELRVRQIVCNVFCRNFSS